MKDIKMPIAPIMMPTKAESAPALDSTYRDRMRTGYGDRGVDKMKSKMGY
jgi:hypothetical protein